MYISSYQINQSFSKYGINSPSKCGFYVMEVGNLILKKYDLKSITETLFIKFYNDFLIKKIGKTLTDFIEERAKLWSQYEKNISFKTLKKYVEDVFVKKSYIGIMREQNVFDELNNYLLSDFEISHTNPFEDNKNGIDFYIKGTNITIGIQVKPISFIRGLKTTTKNSLKKIIKGKPQNIPLFIITENNNEILVHLKSKKDNSLITMSIKTFLSYLNNENAMTTYNKISNDTLSFMLNK